MLTKFKQCITGQIISHTNRINMIFQMRNYIRNSKPEIEKFLETSGVTPKMGFLTKKTCLYKKFIERINEVIRF